MVYDGDLLGDGFPSSDSRPPRSTSDMHVLPSFNIKSDTEAQIT